MHLDIITPTKTMYSDEISQLTAPTTTGEITILPHHINLVSQIEQGELIIKKSGKTDHMAVTGGYLTITNNTITVLADYAVMSENIVYEKALEAQKRAEEAMRKAQENNSDIDFAAAEKEFLRSLLETKVATRRRKTI